MLLLCIRYIIGNYLTFRFLFDLKKNNNWLEFYQPEGLPSRPGWNKKKTV
jgi:hypothetical protein